MVHRLALVIGGVGAAALFGLALVLSNGSPLAANEPVDGATAAVDQLASGAPTASPEAQARVKTVVDTVYVRPARDPQPTATDDNRVPQVRAAEPTAEPTPEPTPDPTGMPPALDDRPRSDGVRHDDRDDHRDDDGHDRGDDDRHDGHHDRGDDHDHDRDDDHDGDDGRDDDRDGDHD